MKSARWGWVDFRHFGASARMVERQGLFALTDGAIVFALVAGESHEQILDDPSQYSYEDLPSNFLGAAFQSMYARGFFAKKSYAAALVAFLRHLEMQDSTVLTETDRRMMDDVVMNRTYSPIGNSRSSWAPKSWVLLEINRLRLVALVAVSPTRPLREAIFNLPVVEDAARSLDQRSR